MPLWNFFQREKPDTAVELRERLVKTGRIAEGRVIDSDGATLAEITQIFYIYSINGADYESSHVLTEDQKTRQTDYAPGAKISVRYDYRQPGNSTVV